MSKGIFTGPIEKIDTCCFRIPKSYRSDMRVDGMIFANDKLMETIRHDQAAEQVVNVATLPGIQGASLAMPDIHWGYGFCIGGVCATDPAEGGVISPGGVGYDINCLTGDAEVMHRFGYTRRIDSMVDVWESEKLECVQLSDGHRISTPVERWFGQKPLKPVLEVTMQSGDKIRATSDHPFWTPSGMKPLGELTSGDTIAVTGFSGVAYEEPTSDCILTEDQFRGWYDLQGRRTGGNAVGQAINYLRHRNLLPLQFSSKATPVLCKIVGFLFGDGTVHVEKATGKGVTSFYGKPDDLETIRADLGSIGVTVSKVYSRQRTHNIKTTYKAYTFDRVESFCKVTSTAFASLMACLGVPVGKKPSQDYTAPGWLELAPLWQKRLFLAGLFGAELTKPATMSGHGKVMAQPVLSLNKRTETVPSGEQFLTQLARWLSLFGVETQSILQRDEQQNADDQRSIRLRLVLSSRANSLQNLWSRIGFEYNRDRSRLAGVAVQYVKHQERARRIRAQVANEIAARTGDDRNPTVLAAKYADQGINRRFVERALYEPSNSSQRLPNDFPTFTAFQETVTAGEGMVWEPIETIELVKDYRGLVYDFTVEHEDHNFVANGFVVSNCGVRLLKTNLFLDDVKHHLRDLVKSLFHSIPAGVGKLGKYKFNPVETRKLMGEGVKFVIDRDLGNLQDLDRTEANGLIDGGDPAEVTDHAVKRGAEQCGTLGSGNHFLEVQVVDRICDEHVAKVFGLELNQVCVMIHSGSRGLGYQVCDDALAAFRNTTTKYGITLPDRQLACAPVDSPEGKKYIAAMRAAANFGFCNRQLLMQQTREVFATEFGRSAEDLGMELLYDVAHNIAKFEEHTVEGKKKMVWVHRKGATRAFPAGHPEVPEVYRAVGQPVIIPGDMGRASWVLVGAPGSMEKTFGTTCHGAGRAMSRTASIKDAAGRRIDKELEARGVIAMSSSRMGLAEEQPKAYKNVDDVVDSVDAANLSRKVARMRPIGVIKG